MRTAFLPSLLISALGICQPPVPPARWFAPSVSEVRSSLAHGQVIYGDTVYNGQRLKAAYATLSGTVLSMRSDSVIHTISHFSNGRRSGWWYTLDVEERVTEATEYALDTTRQCFWYDEQGRLTYYCATKTCADDTFDRIFGGGCPGTCWTLDSARHVTHMPFEDTTGYFETVEYYPNGQAAQRNSHDRSTGRIEQWCPKGKRIGMVETVKDSATAEPRLQGTLIEWSVMEYAYYATTITKDHWKLKKLPKGRWRSYTDKEYHELEVELDLRQIKFNDPKRQAVLPCSLRRR